MSNSSTFYEQLLCQYSFDKELQSQTVRREKLPNPLLYKKGVSKMLMKLRPCRGWRSRAPWPCPTLCTWRGKARPLQRPQGRVERKLSTGSGPQSEMNLGCSKMTSHKSYKVFKSFLLHLKYEIMETCSIAEGLDYRSAQGFLWFKQENFNLKMFWTS